MSAGRSRHDELRAERENAYRIDTLRRDVSSLAGYPASRDVAFPIGDIRAALDALAAAEARGTFTRPESAAPSEPELHHAVSDPAPTDGRLTDAGSGSLGAEGAPPPEGTA